LLEDTLGDRAHHEPGEPVREKLLQSAPRDVEELLPQLVQRAEDLAGTAIERLRQRGEREEQLLRDLLERQRKRVSEQLERYEENARQLVLDVDDFTEEEKRQLDADVRWWRIRLEQFERDLQREPQRVREFYEVRAKRIEPVGLVYLWPETN
jgi:exonuclease VII large subunit